MSNQTRPETCGLFILQADPRNTTEPLFHVFHDLSVEDYTEYLSVAHRIQESLNSYLLVYVKQALDNILSAKSQIEKIIKTTSVYAIQGSYGNWNTAMACCALTFCSALHLHQEQSKTQARRHHEEESAEFAAVTKAFSVAYDNYISYRLLYRLRNELVHHSLRGIGLKLSAREKSASGLIVNQYDVRVPLNRQEFLRANKSVSARIRADLKAMPEDPDLLDLCQQVMPALDDIDREIRIFLNPNLLNDARVLLEIDALFGNLEGVRGFTRVRYSSQMRPAQLPQHVLKPELFDYCRTLLADGA